LIVVRVMDAFPSSVWSTPPRSLAPAIIGARAVAFVHHPPRLVTSLRPGAPIREEGGGSCGPFYGGSGTTPLRFRARSSGSDCKRSVGLGTPRGKSNWPGKGANRDPGPPPDTIVRPRTILTAFPPRAIASGPRSEVPRGEMAEFTRRVVVVAVLINLGLPGGRLFPVALGGTSLLQGLRRRSSSPSLPVGR